MSWDPSADRIAEAVENAPSVSNTRPWRFEISAADRIELRLANLANLDALDRARKREYVISCGAALFNLRLAIRVAGHDLAVRLLPDPEHDSALLASVEIVTGRVNESTIEEQELHEAIWRRHINRSPYKILPVPLPIIVEMEHAAAKEDASLRRLHHRQAMEWMKLVAEADRYLGSPQPASLNSDERDEYEQDERDVLYREQQERFERHPRLMALSTDDDQPLDWLRAGQALQRAILTATRLSVSAPYGLAARYHASPRYGLPARRHLLGHDDVAHYGLSVSFLTQPLERDDISGVPRRWPLRWRFPELPQMVMRVGYAPNQPPSPPLEKEPHIRDARSEPSRQPPQRALPNPDSEAGT